MIRVRTITIVNFKNTRKGTIECADSFSGASILGIYGQNGSGKTSIIDAVECIRCLLSGNALPKASSEYVGPAAENAAITVEFELSGHDASNEALSGTDEPSYVEYRVNLIALEEGQAARIKREELHLTTPQRGKRMLFGHSLTFHKEELYPSENLYPSPFLFPGGNYKTSFFPEGKWRSIRSYRQEPMIAISAEEGVTFQESRSLLFSSGFFQSISLVRALVNDALAKNQKVPKTVETAVEDTVSPLIAVTTALHRFAQEKLSVITTTRTALVSLSVLPIAQQSQKVHENESEPLRDIVLNIITPSTLSLEEYKILGDTLHPMNAVLSSLVPGLSIEAKNLGKEILDNGDEGVRVELLSNRGGIRVPFRNESDGIKKLTVILSLLIDVYNDESACVAIDELDSGVFEFLLGEILEVLSEKGKGQLIFTAHNLRALETLPPASLMFTTVNPDNRYLRFRGKKATNNLRNQYLRAINLGGQKERVYEPTDRLSIDAAFYEAGHADEGQDLDSFLQELRG